MTTVVEDLVAVRLLTRRIGSPPFDQIVGVQAMTAVCDPTQETP